ncbi:MAG: alpha/beta hydrolase [Gammaproteobacteria bacterium]
MSIDVGAAAPRLGALRLAATIFLPDADRIAAPGIVVFAIAGGGYARGYFDMAFPGHRGYSQAEYHTGNGLILVACDPIGVGESTLPPADAITIEDLADTYDTAVREIASRLASGTVVPGFPALTPQVRIGIGQSMGGCITIVTQARRHTFDAIAALGYSAIHTALPQPDAASYERARTSYHVGRDADLSSHSMAEKSATVASFLYPFHMESVPRDIIDADMAGGYPLRTKAPPFGSVAIPTCALTMMTPGVVAAEAAAVSVPVLVGVGERDVCPDPRAEPAAYRGASDISVCIVPDMAHMHNFATTRHRLWRRIESWARGVGAESIAAVSRDRTGSTT